MSGNVRAITPLADTKSEVVSITSRTVSPIEQRQWPWRFFVVDDPDGAAATAPLRWFVRWFGILITLVLSAY